VPVPTKRFQLQSRAQEPEPQNLTLQTGYPHNTGLNPQIFDLKRSTKTKTKREKLKRKENLA